MPKRFLEEHNIIIEYSLDDSLTHRWGRVHIGDQKGVLTVYLRGEITHSVVLSGTPNRVLICFADGTEAEWAIKLEDTLSYQSQFGFSVSRDGRLIFMQTWERGMYAFDTRTGEQVWRTQSKRGITNIYVNEKTVLCHQHEKALQLLDINTGEVLQEKRPANSWGFQVLKEGYILCSTRANRWEIIRTEDLETVETIPDKEFPECLLRDFSLNEDETKLCYYGFKNVWDDSTTPPTRLPNKEFRGAVEIGCFQGEK